MKLNIKYFGMVEEAVAKSEEVREIPASTSVLGLKTALSSFYPPLENLEFKVAVNQELVSEEFVIEEDSEIALLPPFAGG